MQKYNRARKHKPPTVTWNIYHRTENPQTHTDCGFFTDGGSFVYVDKLYRAGIEARQIHPQTSESVEAGRGK